MRILLASSEVHPYSKTGGLADMVGALSKSLARSGNHVNVVTPLYRGILERFPTIECLDQTLCLNLGDRELQAALYSLKVSEELTIYFVSRADFFDRKGIYVENGVEYSDNPERFIFFSKAVAELTHRLPKNPDVVHLHDWQVGLVPALFHHERHNEGRRTPPTCLTVHNLAYQGIFPIDKFGLTNLPWDYFHPDGLEYYNQVNCLKAGLVYSDKILTVSPRYAREIMTEELGCGLDGVLRGRKNDLLGILNGVDYEEWQTTRNPHLRHAFSAHARAGKVDEKLDLQNELGLPVDASIPLFATITRLTEQKGVDIELEALEGMLKETMQFVLLGAGDPVHERAFQELAGRFPSKVAIRIGYDPGLAHRIEAAGDFYLMPSRFEPCGLNQMYSLRYGSVPIVRATGGLDDSVTDITEDLHQANGIKFYDYSSAALAKAIQKALVLYEERELLRYYRDNGMRVDFSWERTCLEHLKVYSACIDSVQQKHHPDEEPAAMA